jgi:hypothetical protein
VLFSPYIGGAGLLGAKMLVCQLWDELNDKHNSVVAVIYFILLVAIVASAGLLYGCIIAPFMLHKERKFLRDTAWVEALNKSS